MEQQTLFGVVTQNQPAVNRRKPTVPDPIIDMPERGSTGPVRLREVMEPIHRIIEHPDRNRLMAEFFKRHW